MNNQIASYDKFNEVWEKISSYLDVKDLVTESECVEVLGDSFSIIKLLRNASNLIIQKRFESFLKGFKDTEKPTEEQLNRLLKYIDDKQKAEFISDIFSKILLSNSKLSCMIMGCIMQKIINTGDNVTHSDLICIDALTKFYDFDIKNFKTVCDNQNLKRSKVINLNNIYKKKENENIDKTSISLTLQKCVSCQLVSLESEVDANFDSDDVEFSSIDLDEYYFLLNTGEKLYEYIKIID